MTPEDIIIRPVLTEKGYDGIADKRYTFVVKKTANKTEIKIAVEKMFGVKVKSVNTVTQRGKLKRMGRNEGYRLSESGQQGHRVLQLAVVTFGGRKNGSQKI